MSDFESNFQSKLNFFEKIQGSKVLPNPKTQFGGKSVKSLVEKFENLKNNQNNFPHKR